MTIPLLAGCGSEQEDALSGKKNTEEVKHDPAKVTKGEAVEDVAVNYNGKESVIIGSIDNNKFVLSLESGSFPEGSKVNAKPLDDDQLKSAVICGKFEQIIAPVDLSVDGYDGSYFGEDVRLTVANPDDVKENDISLLAFCYAEAEKIKEVERQVINTMLYTDFGALQSGYHSKFFKEASYKEYDLSRRLERITKV